MADNRQYEEGTIYEAGVGIYFSDGEDHTNINVEDEVLDKINGNSERLDEIEQNYVESVEVSADNKSIEVKKADGVVENSISASARTTKTTINSMTNAGSPTQFNYISSNETLDIQLGISPTFEAVTVATDVDDIEFN